MTQDASYQPPMPPAAAKAGVDAFFQLDIRMGRVERVEDFPKARKPSWKLWIDFGASLGVKHSSVQAVELYDKPTLTGRLVCAVVNFPPRQIADFMSEVLVLGAYTSKGLVLLQPERAVPLGSRIG